MNRTSWERTLEKLSNSIGVGKEAINIFGSEREHVSSLIKEIEEEFLVLEEKDGSGISAVVELDEIAGFRTE